MFAEHSQTAIRSAGILRRMVTDTSPHLSDDDVRWLTVRTAASLARLWARLKRFACQPGRHPGRPVVAQEIHPPEPWLDAAPPQTALAGILDAIQLAQGLLLLEATGGRPPDVYHHACGI